MKSGQQKVDELELDHNKRQNRLIVTAKNYKNPTLSEALESLLKHILRLIHSTIFKTYIHIYPHIKFNT